MRLDPPRVYVRLKFKVKNMVLAKDPRHIIELAKLTAFMHLNFFSLQKMLKHIFKNFGSFFSLIIEFQNPLYIFLFSFFLGRILVT